jgi:hypothetical protein
MGIEETVAKLRGEVTAAAQRHALAEAGLVQAQARAEAARGDLQAEFGVTTVQAARTMLADLRQQMEAEAAEVRRLLAIAGGTQ